MNFSIEFFFKNFFKLATAIVILVAFIYMLTPFFIPFLFGGMFALAFNPYVKKMSEKFKWSHAKSINYLCFKLILIFIIPFSLFIIRSITFLKTYLLTDANSIEDFKNKTFALLDSLSHMLKVDPNLVQTKFVQLVELLSKTLFKVTGDFIAYTPDLALTAIVTILTFYFFLLKSDLIFNLFKRYFYFNKKNEARFISVLQSSCKEVFFTNILTGIIQSSIVSIAAILCGFSFFYIIFIVTFIVSFIPIIGAAPMAVVISIIAFIDGKVGSGITMLVVAMITGVADNIIRPFLASRGEVEVPALIEFLAVIGGIIVMGLPGLFIGPLLASLVFGIIPIIFEEYFPDEIVE